MSTPIRKTGELRNRSALPPDHMTAAERLDEVAAILALGIVRLRARGQSRGQLRQSSGEAYAAENVCVDFMLQQSGGVGTDTVETTR